MTIRVEIDREAFIHAHSRDMLQFLIRQQLRSAGIPIGPWGTSTVTQGVLSWWTDPATGKRIVTWRSGAAAMVEAGDSA